MAPIPGNQRRRETVLVAAFAGALAVAAIPAAAADAPDGAENHGAENLCARSITASEPTKGIPRDLLTAISLAESGRWDPRKRAIVAWPWTINAGGQGRVFASKEAAIAAVKKLRARGVTSVDVGCMQVNLHFHPDAFEDLEAAFEPARNVAYATRFLESLRNEKRSLSQAVAFYHSSARKYNRPYRKKVFELWSQVHRLAAEQRRQALIRAYHERRAQREARRRAREGGEHPS
ncbi:MAG: murein transglycosylase [Alphaproteobacteria bacterium]